MTLYSNWKATTIAVFEFLDQREERESFESLDNPLWITQFFRQHCIIVLSNLSEDLSDRGG